MDRDTDTPALREFFSMLSRHKIAAVVVFAVATASVAVGAFLSPPVFTASTTLLVKYGREFLYRPEVGDGGARTFDLKEIVNSEVEILRSRELAEQVVEAIGVEALYPEINAEPELAPARRLATAVARFQGDLDITAVFDSSVIRVSFESPDAEVAARSVNLLVERFKEKHLEIFSERTSEVMHARLERYRERLEEAEMALQSFRRENGIHAIEGQKEAIIAQRGQMRSELRQTRSRLVELEKQLAALDASPEDAAATGADPLFSRERAALVSRRSELMAELREIDARIAGLSRSLERHSADRPAVETSARPLPGVERFRSLDEALLRLLDLELREKETLRVYSEESRETAAIREEIRLVEKFLASRGAYVERLLEVTARDELLPLQEQRQGLAGHIAEIEKELGALTREERALRRRMITTELESLNVTRGELEEGLAGLDAELSTLGGKERELRELERGVTVADGSYQTFLQRYEDEAALEELDEQKVVNLRVIEEAAAPIAPTGLSRTVKIALGVVVGLLAAAAAAFFLELLK